MCQPQETNMSCPEGPERSFLIFEIPAFRFLIKTGPQIHR
jgi:hypothetical protein